MYYSFDGLKGAKGNFYRKMWDELCFRSDSFITDINRKGVKSHTSFFIKTTSGNSSNDVIGLANDLIKAFNIKNVKAFKEKIVQACGGSGQEINKISTMHSSSLCSLLLFYGISDVNPLEIRMGNDEKKTYVFNESVFEFQNVVIEGRQPSNMDVVLVGHEKDNKNQRVVLFLESKFSEYYAANSSRLAIAKSYLENKYGQEIYSMLDNRKLYKIEASATKPSTEFVLVAKAPVYLNGIKQMISHYIGVRNLLDNNVVKGMEGREVTKVVMDGSTTVLLGSIIFDDLFSEATKKDKEKYLDSYMKCHEALADVLNDASKISDTEKGLERINRFTVIKEPLTYTDVFTNALGNGFILDEKVKKYYFGES